MQQITINEINDFVVRLEKKLDKAESQQQILLADFLNNFDTSNMGIVEQYSKADELIEKSIAFITKQKHQLLIKRKLLQDRENNESFN